MLRFFPLGIVVFLVLLSPILPPLTFPTGSIVTIPEGVGLYALAEKLRAEKVIRSPFLFRIAAIALGGERDMKAGQYYLSHPQNVFLIVWRVLYGDYDVETVKLTIPEGFTASDITALFGDQFILLDHRNFLQLAPEGYLFPDTYFVPVTATASSTIKLFRDNFTRQIATLLPEVKSSGRTLSEVITMASIIESEAKFREDREIVSGILWRRIALGVPLQVDASFVSINGKTSKELTAGDLKIDSPFNTYLYKGLPPAPISNPGLESIKAALSPTTTSYLYFLTGDDGAMYYSRTFNEHAAKKLKYIHR